MNSVIEKITQLQEFDLNPEAYTEFLTVFAEDNDINSDHDFPNWFHAIIDSLLVGGPNVNWLPYPDRMMDINARNFISDLINHFNHPWLSEGDEIAFFPDNSKKLAVVNFQGSRIKIMILSVPNYLSDKIEKNRKKP